MGMALGVTIVLCVDDHAALSRVFVGMMFGMTHLPVGNLLISLAILAQEYPTVPEGNRFPTQAQWPVRLLSPLFSEEVRMRKAWIPFLIFVP